MVDIPPARSGVKAVLGYGILVTFMIPPISFAIAALLNGMDAPAAWHALVEQCMQHRHNPLLLSIPALLPILVFAGLIWLRSRRHPIKHPGALAASGLGAAIAVQLWVNWSFWNIFLPTREYPGFPHGLEFIIGPVFFTPIIMAISVLATWLVMRGR